MTKYKLNIPDNLLSVVKDFVIEMNHKEVKVVGEDVHVYLVDFGTVQRINRSWIEEIKEYSKFEEWELTCKSKAREFSGYELSITMDSWKTSERNTHLLYRDLIKAVEEVKKQQPNYQIHKIFEALENLKPLNEE